MPPLARSALAFLAGVTAIPLFLAPACRRQAADTSAAGASSGNDAGGPEASVPAASSRTDAAAAERAPEKVEVKVVAMGTHVTFVAYTNARVNEPEARAAIERATLEIRRLESVLSEWRDDSDVGRVNLSPGEWVSVGPELTQVLEKSAWASKLSEGTFDVTFHVLGDLWKFGDARDPKPVPPKPADILSRKRHIDFRKVEVEPGRVRIGKSQKLGLGGIAKGYIVDKAVVVLREAGLDAFLVQAGGDLYGAGRKPDGSAWVSGIRDPRGDPDRFFAVLPLEDHAFSTAGDYARSFVHEGKRYHHIIDPRTGYPATACRSVTVWAPDAFVADAIDDAVFILGPEKGLALVESLDGVGAVLVDAENQVLVSRRLQGKVRILAPPTGGL